MTMVPLPKRMSADVAFAQRRRRYAQNRQLYAGDHRQRDQRNRHPRFRAPRNYIRLFVDSVVAHLGSPRVSFGSGAVADQLEAYLDDALASSSGEQLDYDAEIAATVDGDGAWKVTWDERRGRPRLAAVDPSRLWALARPDDPLDFELVAEQYHLEGGDFPALFGDELVAVGGRSRITEAWTAERWQVYDNDVLRLDEPNPYGFIPYVVYPNLRLPGRAWGTGDPEQLEELQETFNQANEDLDAEMRLAGTIVVLEGIDDSSDIAVQPGSVWNLPPDAKAYLLDYFGSGGPKARLEYASSIRSDLHALARIPADALGGGVDVAEANVSGVALQLRLGPLIRLVARKRLYRAAALRQRALLVAALGARFGGQPGLPPGTVPAVRWSEAIPSNRADELANAETELRLGRSRAAVLRAVGAEDPEGELAARAVEAIQLPSLEASRGRTEPEQ